MSTTTAPLCPICSAPMRQRTGSRGQFWGCPRYRDGCRGTRPLAPAPAARPAEPVSGPTADLAADLRRASGYIGGAIDLLQQVRARLDALVRVAP